MALTSLHAVTVSPAFAEIEKLNAEIIVLECAIFKLDTFFILEHGKQPKGRRWRLATYQTTNYACTFAGLLMNVIYNFYYYPRGGHATVIAQLGATTPRFVGKAVYLTGLTYEMFLQAIEHYKEKKQGFDSATFHRKIIALQKALDEPLSTRHRQAGALTKLDIEDNEHEMIVKDGELLQQARNLALNEYCSLYARAKSISTRNRMFNTLTFLKKADATFGADLVRILGGAELNNSLSAPASMSTTISGAMSAFDPWIEMYSENISYKSNDKKAGAEVNLGGSDKLVGANTLSGYDRNVLAWNQSVAQYDLQGNTIMSDIVARHDHFYRGIGGTVDSWQYLRTRELHAERLHDIHSRIYHAIYGGSKLSRGAWLIYVGFRYRAKHSALLNGFAGIDNLAGAAYLLADFLTCDYLAIKNRRQDELKGISKVAMMRARLDVLDTMEEDAKECYQDVKSINN